MSKITSNDNPLLPGYSFNLYLVSGLSPIFKGRELDFLIDRPQGMKGYIMNYTIKGSGIIYQDNQSFICNKGDFILFPTGVPHLYGRNPDADEWQHLWVYFIPKSYWLEWLDWERLIGNIRYYRPQIERENSMKQLFKKIVNAGRSSNVYSELMAMNLLEHFLILHEQEKSKPIKNDIDKRIYMACQYIINTLSQQGSILEQTANHVCLSPSRLSHLFKQEVGISLSKWREEQRINKAKILLHTTVMPISSISREVGYDDPLYFSRLFSNTLGCSPSQYRKNYQKHRKQYVI